MFNTKFFVCLALILIVGCPLAETEPLKSGLISTVSQVQYDPEQPTETVAEAFVYINNGKPESLPAEAAAPTTFKDIPRVTFFSRTLAPTPAEVDASKEFTLGCAHGPEPKLSVSEADAQRIATHPEQDLILAVSGKTFTPAPVHEIKGQESQNAWLGKKAETELKKAYSKLSEKPDALITPLLIKHFKIPNHPETYALASYQYVPKNANDPLWDTMPSIFMIAVYHDQHAKPDVLYKSINTNTERVQSFAFLDVTGDPRPELITQIHGYEWYYFQILSLTPKKPKRLWSGGGGGC